MARIPAQHASDIERGDNEYAHDSIALCSISTSSDVGVDHDKIKGNKYKRPLLCEVQPLTYKDIGAELQGLKDLSRFADDPNTVVMLDTKESATDKIIEVLLDKMVKNGQLIGNDAIKEDVKRALLGDDFTVSRPFNEQDYSFDNGKHWHRSIQGPGFIIPFGKICALDGSCQRVVGVVRILTPTNLGAADDSLTKFLVAVLAPVQETICVEEPVELARTFASLFQDDEFFEDAIDVTTSTGFKTAILEYLARHQEENFGAFDEKGACENYKYKDLYRTGRFAGGLIEDIKRKYKWSVYRSDWTDGLTDPRSLLKYLSTIIRLYFAIIMPTIAFGALNDKNTKLPGDERGQIGVIETTLSQAVSGLVFATISGQPLVIIMTTGPLTVFIEVLFSWSKSMKINFLPFYAWTGLWTAAILMLLVVTDSCAFIRFCGHFTEEIFATLVAAIFIGEFVKPLIAVARDEPPDIFLLAFLLGAGTYLLAHWLSQFRFSFLLNPSIRVLLSDFGVPIAILLMSSLRRAFMSVHLEMLSVPDHTGLVTSSGRSWIVPMFSISIQHILVAGIPGFLLATLFFLNQNISSVLVNRPENKLKKGVGYHLDLAVVSALVVLTSIFGMTWTHAVLAHSPMHARAIADVNEYEEHGRTYERVVKARETRVTAFVTHILIALSVLIMDFIGNVPVAVLYGFFLYLGVTILYGNPLWERVLLIFTSRVKYPLNCFVRRVPVKRIHFYTAIQVFLVVILWLVKSNFYLGDTTFNIGLLFPFTVTLLILIRRLVLPMIFRQSELAALESNE